MLITRASRLCMPGGSRVVLSPISQLSALRNPRVSRPQSQFHSSAPRASPTELESVLRAQDKHDRIMFCSPARMVNAVTDYDRLLRVRQLFPGAEFIEPQLLPFYTVGLLADLRWSARHTKTGQPGSGFPERQYFTLTGCTVAAVAEDHWAHGVVLADDMILTAHSPIMEHMTSSTDMFTMHPGPKGEPLLPEYYDPRMAPAFAYGPPMLTRVEQQKLVDMQGLFGVNPRGWVDVRHLQPGGITTYSFPHYRFVYKVDCADGLTAFFDTTDFLANHTFDLKPATDTDLTRRAVYTDDDISRWWKQQWLEHGRVPIGEIGARFFSTEEAVKFHNMMIRALRRNPATSATWDDPHIFPMIAQGEGEPDIAAVLDYSIETCILGKDTASPPTFLQDKATPTLSAHLLRPRRTPAKDKKEPSQANEATKAAKEKETPSPAPTRRPSLLRGSSHKDTRERVLSKRLRSEVNRQQAWKANKAASGFPSSPPPVSDGRPQPIPRGMSDPKNYYDSLGLKVAQRYLDYAQEEVVNRELQTAKWTVSKKYHPDARPPHLSDEEHEWYTDKLQYANHAYDQLKTCEMRVRYHNASLIGR